jgi:endoribonuclease Dicer
MRQQTVSNSVLYQYALEKGLQSYIQADRFAPSRWAAPGVPPVFDEDTKDGEELDKRREKLNKRNERKKKRKERKERWKQL